MMTDHFATHHGPWCDDDPDHGCDACRPRTLSQALADRGIPIVGPLEALRVYQATVVADADPDGQLEALAVGLRRRGYGNARVEDLDGIDGTIEGDFVVVDSGGYRFWLGIDDDEQRPTGTSMGSFHKPCRYGRGGPNYLGEAWNDARRVAWAVRFITAVQAGEFMASLTRPEGRPTW